MTIFDFKKGCIHDNDEHVGYRRNVFSCAVDVFDDDFKVYLSHRDIFKILELIDLYTLQRFVNKRMQEKMKEEKTHYENAENFIKEMLEGEGTPKIEINSVTNDKKMVVEKIKRCHLNDTGNPYTSHALCCTHDGPCSECDRYY